MDDSKDRSIGLRIRSDPDVTGIEQPQARGARPVTRLPLRLLLVSDLTPQAEPDWPGPSRVISVDKHNFGDMMRQAAPRLEIEVPNRISDTPAVLDIELQFEIPGDFHPERLVAQVPSLGQLAGVRQLVGQVVTGAMSAGAFQKELETIGVDAGWARELHSLLSAPERPSSKPPPTAPASPSESSDPLDRLFGMVDAGPEPEAQKAPEESEAGDLMGALMQAATGPSSAGSRLNVEKDAGHALIRNLDDVIGEQLDAIMNHPAFRRLENAWLGLKFLVDRIDFRKNIQLDVLSAGKDALSEAFYHQVLIPEYEADRETAPLSAIILDHAFDSTRPDFDLLEDLAGTGASLQVPVIASAAPAFFGIAEPAGLDRLPLLNQHLRGPQYIAWNKLRGEEAARYLALVPIPFLLRNSYGSAEPIPSFDFEESGQAWGNGSLLVAAVIAGSFARTGWPTHLRRNGSSGIGDLPLWKTGGTMIPLAAALGGDKQSELAEAGFVVPGCRVNDDRATIEHEPTVYRPAEYDDAEALAEARLHATVSCQLFMTRVAQFILELQARIDASLPVEDAKREVEEAVHSFLGTTPQENAGVDVRIIDGPKQKAGTLFLISMEPPPQVLKGKVSLSTVLKIDEAG